MSDYLVRAISKDGSFRGFAGTTTHLVQELQRKHVTFPTASAALGRTATMGALMGLELKNEKDVVTIQVKGDGPLGEIMVVANGQGHVRGYVDQPDVMIPLKENGKIDVSGGVGQGYIYIMRDIGMREPYRGSAPIVSGELAEDFTYYYSTSEQVPSSIGLGVLVNRDQILFAGGYMIQVLPGASDEAIDELEKRIMGIPSVTALLESGLTPEEILYRLLGDDAEILATKPVEFQCACSLEKTKSMLASLGKKDLQDIIEQDEKAEVVCHFCNSKYQFSKEELEEILGEISGS
ncbi:molecular chaperone Hsp33 [Croceifilum oryzae]|uniref:33 kDa chaperonin n=1 Tax=Croceifilum oryzae TaxID=1553429 RepID=A0AAJ1TJW9_9BACL|nr:Hsp33 family molecular chaperone HslO [Croceifilum oryzae]MDQ0418267.1 molecular chaperone Hsp33 [Croceifilum oryzae]